MSDDPRNRPPEAPDGGRARPLDGGKREPHIPPGGLPFGRYTLLRRISYGGMGEIFLAKQAGLGSFKKLLVIKRLLSHYRSDEDIVSMFFDEAKLQSAMSDRHIVQIWDMGEVDKHYFIAMEYVQGQSWRRLIELLKQRGEHIHPAHAVDLAVQVCRGMSFAHNLVDGKGRQLSVVHRDLNPQNVLLSYDGECKIIDFGIAKSALSGVHTEEGTIKGKFAYMAPEQARAEPVDRRSDIFAFGICLYELLTTKNPFYRKNVVLSLEAICEKQVPPVERVRPAVAALSPVVERCLMKDADDRFADMSEVGEALSGIYKDGLLGDPPVSLSDWLHEVFEAEINEQARFLLANGFSSITLKRPISESDPNMQSPYGVGAEITSRKARALMPKETELLEAPPEPGKVDTHPTATLAVDLASHLSNPSRGSRGGELLPQNTDASLAIDVSVPGEFSEDTELPPDGGAAKQAASGVGLLLVALLTAVVGAGAAFYAFLVWDLPDKTPTAAWAHLEALLAPDGEPVTVGPLPSLDPDVATVVDADAGSGAETAAVGAATDAGVAADVAAAPGTPDAGTQLAAATPPVGADAGSAPGEPVAANEEPTPDAAATATPSGSNSTSRQRKADRRRRLAAEKAAAKAAAEKAAAEKAAAAANQAVVAGVLTVNAGGPFRIRGGGVSKKNVARVKIGAEKATTITIGGGPMALKLRVQDRGGKLSVRVGSEPWAIIRVNNIGKGRTPLALSVSKGGRLAIELKSPKAGEMRVTLGYAAP